MPTSTGPAPSRIRGRLQTHGLLLVLLLTALACLPALGNGFAQDGKLLVMVEGNDQPPNPMVAELRPLRVYFQSSYWKGAGESAELYRPMTVLSFALVRHGLGRPLGNDAFMQHLVDVLLHLLAVALTFLLLRALSVAPGTACAGALVFGLHALHAEAIASVVGRAELLAFIGGAGGTLLVWRALGGCATGCIPPEQRLFVRLRASEPPKSRPNLPALRPREPERTFAADAWRLPWRTLLATGGLRRMAWVAAATVVFFIGLSAKESALPWLVFAPLVLACCDPKRGWRGALLGTLACAPAAIAFLTLRAAAVGSGAAAVPHSVNPLFAAEPTVRTATATVVWAYGLWKTVFPFWLVSDYGGATFALRTTFFDPAVAGAALVLLGMAAASLWALRRVPLLGLAGACCLGFSLLTANLVFPIGTVFAERLWYTPSLAVAVVAAWLVQRHLARRWLLAVLGAWLLASAWVLVDRLGDWRDDATLLLRDVARNPRATRLHTGASEMLWAHGDLEAACRHAQQAVVLDPGFAGAWSNLGCLLLERQSLAEAEAALRSGLATPRQNPTEARLLHVNLGRALLAQSRPAEALATLQEARRLAPDFPMTLWLMLEAAAELGRNDLVPELVVAGERAVPGDPRWALHRGLLALRSGDGPGAERELRAAIAGGLDDARSRKALEQALALPVPGRR